MVMSSWMIWAIFSAVFAALTAIFARAGLSAGIDPDMATLLRTGIILVVLAVFVWMTGKWSDPGQISPRAWGFITLSALATGASWVCYFRALQQGEVSKVAPIDKLSIVLVVIFAVLFLGERPSLREWAGISLVALGVGVLAFK